MGARPFLFWSRNVFRYQTTNNFRIYRYMRITSLPLSDNPYSFPSWAYSEISSKKLHSIGLNQRSKKYVKNRSVSEIRIKGTHF